MMLVALLLSIVLSNGDAIFLHHLPMYHNHLISFPFDYKSKDTGLCPNCKIEDKRYKLPCKIGKYVDNVCVQYQPHFEFKKCPQSCEQILPYDPQPWFHNYYRRSIPGFKRSANNEILRVPLPRLGLIFKIKRRSVIASEDVFFKKGSLTKTSYLMRSSPEMHFSKTICTHISKCKKTKKAKRETNTQQPKHGMSVLKSFARDYEDNFPFEQWAVNH